MIEPSEEETAIALLRVITLLEVERASYARRIDALEQEERDAQESLPPPAGAAEAVFAAASSRLRALEREVQECKGEIAARGAVLGAIVATCNDEAPSTVFDRRHPAYLAVVKLRERLHEARRAPLHVSASGLDAPDRDV